MDKILRQTSYLFMAQIFGRILGFFYTIYLANALGVLDFGLYSTALAYLSLTIALIDFGLDRFLVREIAIGRMKINEILSNVGLLRLGISSVIFGLMAIFLYYFDPDKLRVHILLLTIMVILPATLSQTLDSVFVAIRKLQYSAASLIALNLSTVIMGVTLIKSGYGIYGAISGLIYAHLIYLIILIIFLKKNKISILANVSYQMIKKSLTGGLPYGLLAVVGIIYFKIDTLMLAYLRGSFDTGIYSAGYKFLEAIVFIPNIFFWGAFPVFAKLNLENSHKMKKIYLQSIAVMVILGFLVLISYNLILPTIIKVFLPNYLSSIEVIRILSIAIPFMFVYVPISAVLLSSEKYVKPIIILSLIPLSFNIITNLIFIPKFGFLAASWTTVASDILSTVLILAFTKKVIFNKS